jgi:hypothetical protein
MPAPVIQLASCFQADAVLRWDRVVQNPQAAKVPYRVSQA